jgi:hypothetical protein
MVPKKRPLTESALVTVTSPDVALIRFPAPVVALLATLRVSGINSYCWRGDVAL